MEAHAMVWEWPIWVYLFVAGVAGGGFFATFLVNQFSGGKYKHLLKISTWIGVPLVGIGVLLLIIDLGNQLAFWHLVVRFLPVSAMSLGTWILNFWAIIGVMPPAARAPDLADGASPRPALSASDDRAVFEVGVGLTSGTA